MEVPSEVLPKLVCENCDGYLSRGPVHLMDNVRYRCGRCLPSEEDKGTRIEAYEELAKLMTFPCRYKHNGCPSQVPFAENEVHEEACPYRKYVCPIAESGQCEWTGIQTELLQHCQQDHPASVVENPCKFTHNITLSSLHNYILWTLGVLFLIQTKVCTVSRKLYHSVRLISDPARTSDYKYTLCIQNKDSRFYKDRQVAARGCLALQTDSSIQTDINSLLSMLEDFTATTFTVTVQSAGNGTTMEASTVESNSLNTRRTTPVKTLEVRVECAECTNLTKPLYRGGWLCSEHAPKQQWCGRCGGCYNTQIFESHKSRFCKSQGWCELCGSNMRNTTQDVHYSQAHGDITHRAGTVCTVSPVKVEHELWINDSDLGRLVCRYGLHYGDFAVCVYTPLPSDQLYKYRCAVNISHPDTGHIFACTSIVSYDKPWDWRVRVPRTDFDKYSQYNKVNIQISVTKMDPSEFVL